MTTHSDVSDDELAAQLTAGYSDAESVVIQRALGYAKRAEPQRPPVPCGINVARRLTTLGADAASLQAALLSDPALLNQLDEAEIGASFDAPVANLVRNVRWLNSFDDYSKDHASKPEQAERLRRMLLAMVDDARAVVIKLAYRIERLSILPQYSYEHRLHIARETMDIYAPLANRLGVGQLKWELEDLSFRYLNPQAYKKLAKALAEKRNERERYITSFVEQLRQILKKKGIKAKVYGRPKHIYSIWSKMQRKQVELDELYDLRAVRILVKKIPTCYKVLGEVHSRWHYVPKEFDDYIASPKENGYQSLHTVVAGPGGAMVEVQIRTRAMHDFAELGVAAHWRYKEGGKDDVAVEKSIASLRSLLDSDEDSVLLDDFHIELFSDRIFVLTPQGELKDLSKGSTPLDFAYTIHTDIGHRCRGARVDGRIVPLSYILKSGERVEVITSKEGGPSRSWLNQNLGYIHSTHARTKIRHWFRKQDHQRNRRDGKSILERERQQLGLEWIEPNKLMSKLANHFHLARSDDLLIAIGRADISANQLSNACELVTMEPSGRLGEQLAALKPSRRVLTENHNDQVLIDGVGNLLTSFALCCKPVPGDAIIGFITRGNGVAIHRKDCNTILNLPEEQKRRLIVANWGEQPETFTVDVIIEAYNRHNLLRDITQLLSTEKISIQRVDSRTNAEDQSVRIELGLAVHNLPQLSRVLDKLQQISNIYSAKRMRS